ncbi:TetR/AcrR family transcriptional regulator [Hoyosella subflava]|uniref:Transcriptional regulator, TetR family n=1 Tax=Hoyosella subflava (strain DSM 45089 / JCM 17490 / NBRC 109087 / DQS3-9A1) TaxID=443218 RepID=F6ES95_HOYSD|nr:TetR/AcrR family transcriptional regulator [Hoyosella subflava]AEF42099.1 Transcriptional regulator, TetR family [Hoyosella subflava DQS3-9A1]
MPRVSEEHLSARREQILSAAWRCFARNGFHMTSMQDILSEADLSAGAVYRYFPGKLDLIKATAERVSYGLTAAFDTLDAVEPVPPPAEAFGFFASTMLQYIASQTEDLTRVAMHVWSEALREKEISDQVKTVGTAVLARWMNTASRWKDAGHIAQTAEVRDVAKVMYSAMVGFIVQRNLLGDLTVEQYVSGLDALIHSSAAPVSSDTD